MEKSPESSHSERTHKIQDTSSSPVPISRENKIWLGVITCILVVGFIALFLIM